MFGARESLQLETANVASASTQARRLNTGLQDATLTRAIPVPMMRGRGSE